MKTIQEKITSFLQPTSNSLKEPEQIGPAKTIEGTKKTAAIRIPKNNTFFTMYYDYTKKTHLKSDALIDDWWVVQDSNLRPFA